MFDNLPIILTIYSDFAIALLRVVVGMILVAHGWPKIKDLKANAAWFESVGFKPGIIFGTFAAALEFIGGLGLIAGISVRYIALLLMAQFIVIILWRLRRRDPLVGGSELDFLILAASYALATFGPGAFALRDLFGI